MRKLLTTPFSVWVTGSCRRTLNEHSMRTSSRQQGFLLVHSLVRSKMAKMSPWKMAPRSLQRIIFQLLDLVRLSRSLEIPERRMPAFALESMRMSWSMSLPMARVMRKLLRNTVTRPICRQQKWRVKLEPSAFF